MGTAIPPFVLTSRFSSWSGIHSPTSYKISGQISCLGTLYVAGCSTFCCSIHYSFERSSLAAANGAPFCHVDVASISSACGAGQMPHPLFPGFPFLCWNRKSLRGLFFFLPYYLKWTRALLDWPALHPWDVRRSALNIYFFLQNKWRQVPSLHPSHLKRDYLLSATLTCFQRNGWTTSSSLSSFSFVHILRIHNIRRMYRILLHFTYLQKEVNVMASPIGCWT